MAKKTKLNKLLIALLRQSRQKSKWKECGDTIDKLTKTETMSDDLLMTLTSIPSTSRRDVWHTYQNKILGTIRENQKSLNTRERNKWRIKMKHYKHRREEQRKSQSELKKYINYALQRPTPEQKPLTMMEQTKQGMVIIDGEEEIKKKEREVTQVHMGKNRIRYYIHKQKMMPELQQTEEGRQWRRKLQTGTLTTKEWSNIPKELRPVFRHARRVKTTTGEVMTEEKYGDLFTKEVTIQELDKYLTTVKNNTAPGMSGIRIDHIKSLPRQQRESIAKLISIPYITGVGYSDWGKQIVNWIPKGEGNPDINKRRPLMYYEVLWKVCIGVRVKRVLKIWLKNGGICH